jgi:hypothetical protein
MVGGPSGAQCSEAVQRVATSGRWAVPDALAGEGLCVGPFVGGGGEAGLLRSAHRSSIRLEVFSYTSMIARCTMKENCNLFESG